MNQDIKEESKAWAVVNIARNSNRPSSSYYIKNICDKFVSLNGDRTCYDDQSVIAGISKINGMAVTIIGISKGENLKENLKRNFGMARPEGYKKALRVMKLAERNRMPIVCLIDTPGAYCGIEAEEKMRLTAADLKELGVIDKIIDEPYGGAHNNREEAANNLRNSIVKELNELINYDINKLIEERYSKFRMMGNMWD